MEYFTHEMEESAEFPAELSGKKLDWECLEKTQYLSREGVELHCEIYELRRASPYPTEEGPKWLPSSGFT